MNILFTCAGRRNYLVQYFREALQGRGLVFAADSSDTAPALFEADGAFKVPLVSDPDYIQALLSICRKNNISVIFSLNDLELPVLADSFDLFRESGILPVVSSKRVIDICFDKWKTIAFADSLGVKTPKTFLSLDVALAAIKKGDLNYPLIIKPRWGSASLCVEHVQDEDELLLAYPLAMKRLSRSFLADASSVDIDHSILIQEKIDGIEYGLDILNTFDGTPAGVYVKQKLSMRAGETDKAVTRHKEEIEKLGRRIGTALGHIANLDCDLFQNERGLFLLEMNPRFGGGYPFTHAAGVNIPAVLLAWLEQKEFPPMLLEMSPDITSAKCDRVVVCRNTSRNKEVF